MKLSYITFHPADDSAAAMWVEEQMKELNFPFRGEKSCGTVKEFLTQFAADVAEHDVILLGVGEREFQRVKTTVAKALGMPLVVNEQAYRRLSTLHGMEEAYCAMQAALPEEAQPLLTEDGRNTGFYAQSGTQHLLFFSLDDEYTGSVCNQYVFPILMGLLFPEGVPCPLTEQEKKEVEKAAEGLSRHGLLLSIAETAIASTVEDIVAEVPQLRDVLVLPQDNDSKCSADEVMPKAKEVRRAQQTAFGGAVSSVFEENGAGQIHIALAAPGRALRSQLSAPIQAERNLKKTAVVCLCSMVNHQLAQIPCVDEAASEVKAAKAGDVKSKAPLIFGVLVALAVIICVIVGIVLKNNGAKPTKTAVGAFSMVQMEVQSQALL